jgi:hypothetical protein
MQAILYCSCRRLRRQRFRPISCRQRRAATTSTRISHAPEKQTRPARHVLNSVKERTIHFHFDRRRCFSHRGRPHDDRRGGSGGFGPFLIDGDEGFVKNIREIEMIVRFTRRDPVEICAPARLIECVLRIEAQRRSSCALRKARAAQFRFEPPTIALADVLQKLGMSDKSRSRAPVWLLR